MEVVNNYDILRHYDTYAKGPTGAQTCALLSTLALKVKGQGQI